MEKHCVNNWKPRSLIFRLKIANCLVHRIRKILVNFSHSYLEDLFKLRWRPNVHYHCNHVGFIVSDFSYLTLECVLWTRPFDYTPQPWYWWSLQIASRGFSSPSLANLSLHSASWWHHTCTAVSSVSWQNRHRLSATRLILSRCLLSLQCPISWPTRILTTLPY